MAEYNYNIEDWWRHLGCYDRERASGIPYVRNGSCKIGEFLIETDEWWDNLSYSQREEVYNDFFAEY